VSAWLYCRHTGVFDVNEEGAPTIEAPEEVQVVDGLLAVDITTYLTPLRFEFDAGRVIAKDAPAVPVKYVFTFVNVASVSALVVTTLGA